MQTTDGSESFVIEEDFEIRRVIGTDNQTEDVDSVAYRNIEQGTADISAYKDRLATIRETQAEIDARQANLTQQSGGGIGLPGIGFGGFGTLALITGGGYLLLQNRSGSGSGTTVVNSGRRNN
jgi:hypothetical protein